MGSEFRRHQKMLEETLGVKVPLNPYKEPIAPLGTMFWFRPKALHQLFDIDWKYEDFPPEPNKIDGSMLHFIERAYGYLPQANGYYTGFVYSDHSLALSLPTCHLMYRHLRVVRHLISTLHCGEPV